MHPVNRLSLLGLDRQPPIAQPILLVPCWKARRRTTWQALRCALQGLAEAWRTQPNLRLHVSVGGGVIALGAWRHLSVVEWLWVSFAIGLVIFAELMNKAIEQTVDLVVGLRPDPLARQVKDLAAGCVLAAACLAVVIGVLTLGPHLL